MHRLLVFILILILNVQSAWAAKYADPSCSDLSKIWKEKLAPELHIPEADWTLDNKCEEKRASFAFAAEFLSRHLPDLYERLIEADQIVLAGPSPDHSLADTEAETGLISIYDSLLEESREYIAAQLVHESAHLRTDDIDHVTCEVGNLKGEEASCAAVFTGETSGDAYNFTYFTLHQFYLLGATQPEIDRPAIRTLILDVLKNNFNQTPEELISKWENAPSGGGLD